MMGCVPSLVAEVNPSGERGFSIDDADFFVVGATKGMPIIENKVNIGMNMVPNPALPALALKNVEIGVIPHQKVKMKIGFFGDDPKNLFFQTFQAEWVTRAKGPWKRQA